jgi:hypothetical protein
MNAVHDLACFAGARTCIAALKLITRENAVRL